MKTMTQYEIRIIAGGTCLCRCRQYHTENITTDSLPENWYMFNGKTYEDIITGCARDVSECLNVCSTMMAGNLLKTCLTLVTKEKGRGKTVLQERKSEL
jgi:hypothetical protein